MRDEGCCTQRHIILHISTERLEVSSKRKKHSTSKAYVGLSIDWRAVFLGFLFAPFISVRFLNVK